MRLLLCGDYGSGKTTLAKQLAEKYNLIHASYATAILDQLCILIGSENRDKLENKSAPWVRPLLQAYGTAKRDLEGENYWVGKTCAKLMTSPQGFVIDDARFLNEVQYTYDTFPDLKLIMLGEPEGYELELFYPDFKFEHHSDYLKQVEDLVKAGLLQ